MPKSPVSPRIMRSPRTVNPYSRDGNTTNPGSAATVASFDRPDSHRSPGTLSAPKLASPPKTLAIASNNVNEPAYWVLKGDFLRSGVHVFSKSGKHPIDDPLANTTGKEPRWLQIQLNVVVSEVSHWTCELMLNDLGGHMCGKETLIAVQSNGVSVDKKKGKYTICLTPAPNDEDPRLAVSYFIPYQEKLYMQAKDGTLPYSYVLQRVSGKKEDKAGRKKWWK